MSDRERSGRHDDARGRARRGRSLGARRGAAMRRGGARGGVTTRVHVPLTLGYRYFMTQCGNMGVAPTHQDISVDEEARLESCDVNNGRLASKSRELVLSRRHCFLELHHRSNRLGGRLRVVSEHLSAERDGLRCDGFRLAKFVELEHASAEE